MSSLKRTASVANLDEDEYHKITHEDLVRYQQELATWTSKQWYASLVLTFPYGGMISTVDVADSYRTHRQTLIRDGYQFGTYKHPKSLFELLDAKVFYKTDYWNFGRQVLHQAEILVQINKGSKPELNRVSMLVMMNTKYVTPLADMIHLLVHPHTKKICISFGTSWTAFG